jgi:hypothetical protein
VGADQVSRDGDAKCGFRQRVTGAEPARIGDLAGVRRNGRTVPLAVKAMISECGNGPERVPK